MEQKEPVLVLYDREEEYARLFSEYLKRQKELPTVYPFLGFPRTPFLSVAENLPLYRQPQVRRWKTNA